jgi:hypothetical protein
MKSSQYKKRQRENLEFKKLEVERDRLYRNKNRKKVRAQVNLRSKIYAGIIKRMPCQICGEIKTDGHHTDYSRPYSVIWLCRKHHVAVHKNKITLYL